MDICGFFLVFAVVGLRVGKWKKFGRAAVVNSQVINFVLLSFVRLLREMNQGVGAFFGGRVGFSFALGLGLGNK